MDNPRERHFGFDRKAGIDMNDIGDIAAGSGIIAALVGILPEIAALLAIVWTGIRIYEWARFRIFKDRSGEQPNEIQ